MCGSGHPGMASCPWKLFEDSIPPASLPPPEAKGAFSCRSGARWCVLVSLTAGANPLLNFR